METWHCPLILFFAFLIKLLHESLKSMRNFIFCGIFFFDFHKWIICKYALHSTLIWFTQKEKEYTLFVSFKITNCLNKACQEIKCIFTLIFFLKKKSLSDMLHGLLSFLVVLHKYLAWYGKGREGGWPTILKITFEIKHESSFHLFSNM